MSISFEVLENFYTVVQCGSMNKAAEEACVDYTALVRQMKKLEGCYGKLFMVKRHGRQSLSLTAQGEVVYDYAKEVLVLQQRLEEKLVALNNGQGQLLKLGIVPGLTEQVYADVLTLLKERHSYLQLSVMEGNVEQQEKAVLTGDVELGLSNSAILHEQDFQILWKKQLRYKLVCPRVNPWLEEKGHYSLSDLQGIPICATVNSIVRLRSAFASMGIVPNIVASHTRRQSSIFAASLGFGVAVYPTDKAPENQQLLCLDLEAPNLVSHEILYKRKEHVLSPLAAEFVELFLEKYR